MIYLECLSVLRENFNLGNFLFLIPFDRMWRVGSSLRYISDPFIFFWVLIICVVFLIIDDCYVNLLMCWDFLTGHVSSCWFLISKVSRQVFSEINVSKNLAKFIGKHLGLNLFLITLQAYEACSFIAKYLWTTFFIVNLWWLHVNVLLHRCI